MNYAVSHIRDFLLTIPKSVTLVAVSKTIPVEIIREVYNAGHKIFGENKVQELIIKKPYLPDDIKWHMIGHMQSNKVKFIAPFINMIHSVDSAKLLGVINNEGLKNNRIINCLLQVHIAEEETKYGFSYDEVQQLFNKNDNASLNNARICGLMGMATFTDNKDQVRKEFKKLAEFFHLLKHSYFSTSEYFRELSMGMSGDYKIALEEGATIIRIGSVIFGKRD